MPQPDWMQARPEYGDDGPHKAMEILGLGAKSRKSKTYLTGPDMAWIMTKLRAKRRITIEALRAAHACHYDRPTVAENEDGDMVQVGWEPDALNDEQVIALYSSAKFWDELHQEFVEHMASHEGFSVKAVSGLDDEERTKGPESSAGAERRQARSSDQGNTRW